MSFSVNQRQAGPVTVLEVSGRLTAGEGCDRLKGELQGLISVRRRGLLLECSQVKAIDSQGIQTLVAAVQMAAECGATVKLLKVSQRMKEALDLTRLSSRIESFDDEEAALRSFIS